VIHLASAAGDEKDGTVQQCSVYHTDSIGVELNGHFTAAVTTAASLEMYAFASGSGSS